jgi:hypothetical protein
MTENLLFYSEIWREFGELNKGLGEKPGQEKKWTAEKEK